MCAAVGILNRGHNPPHVLDVVEAMLARVHHHGPDAEGAYIDDRIALEEVTPENFDSVERLARYIDMKLPSRVR